MLETCYLLLALLLGLSLVGGLVRVVRGPTRNDRMLAAQLFGTTGVAILLLDAAAGARSSTDVALVFAALAVVNASAFVRSGAAVTDSGPHR